MNPTQFKLLNANSQLGLKNGIYQNIYELFRDSELSNYLNIAVAEVFSAATNKGLFSTDIEQALNTDELKDALTSSGFNYLRSLDLSGVSKVLDLSEDFGGVAHYLADHVVSVESIKVDPDLARLATNRCANKHNVCHISECLDKLVFPTAHYDLIIVGQLEALKLSKTDFASLLAKLQSALSSNGVLVVNTLNSARLNKWFDPASANPTKKLEFSDLYASTEHTGDAIEFNRKPLRDLLLASNFTAVDFHASFGHGLECKNLFSEDYLTANVNALNHFYRLGCFDNSKLNEYLLFQSLWQQKLRIVDHANRFLVLAGNRSHNLRQIYDNDFTHYPGTSRQPQWRAITSRVRSANAVEKTAVYPDLKPKNGQSTALITQNLSSQPFHKGRLLVDEWLNAVYQGDNIQFTKLVEEYSDWLKVSAEQDCIGEHLFSNVGYDALPFNIVLGEREASRDFQLIDIEWQINHQLSADFILFRALFWFAFENKALLKSYAASNDLYSIALFVVQHMSFIQSVEELNQFAELEEKIQSEIDNNFRVDSVKQALLQSFDEKDAPRSSPLRLDTAWSTAEGVTDDANTVVCQWGREANEQTLRFDIAGFEADKPILRIDPISEPGAFSLNHISIADEQGESIWSLNSSADIEQNAKLNNISKSDKLFLALTDDPHFLFDLSTIDNIDRARTLKLILNWHWAKGYSTALDTLSEAVNTQNKALVAQANRLNQYRAEYEFQDQRICDLLGHRLDLTTMFKDGEATKANLRKEIKQLNARLHQQTVRNDELHGHLLMRPTTRAKRVAARTLSRITGNVNEVEEVEPKKLQQADEVQKQNQGLIGQNYENYDQWISENDMTEAQIKEAKAEIEAMEYKPTFSILVPIYNTDPEYLIPMIRSVQAQIYPHWQLCLVDDCSPKGYLKRILEYEASQDSRISIQLNDVNQGISVTTNDALALATGDYIGLLDHDDELSIDALYHNAKVINANPDAGLIYSDEDKMDLEGNRLEPYFKPDYSPDLLATNNYICHFTVIKKSIAEEIGGFREGLDGSQDHDIILRAADAAERVVHIPKILYHWRKIPGSTAVEYDSKSYAWEAGRKAVEDSLVKKEGDVKVEFGTLKGTYRVVREIKGEPLVSIIIPFKDKPELLDSCLDSILGRTSYTNYEIVGVNNNSEQDLTFERIAHFKKTDQRIRFVDKNMPFNFSAICNYGVEQANGDYIILLNNDIEIISPDWIERMLEHAQRDEIGAVGGKLLYPDGRIQHAGVVAGMVGAAGHPHKFFPDQHIGYHGRLHMVCNVSAVTGAMMMMRTDKFKEVGGLDEDNLAIAYNDIDLCLKLMDKGYINLFTPHAKATHHESISRGYEDTDEKVQRLLKEQSHFLEEWAEFLAAGDPYYNPNLSLKNERFSLNFKD